MTTVGARIDGLIRPPTALLLKAFFDDAGPFAGRTFDELPDNRPNRLTPSDMVSVTLLDIRFKPQAARALLGTGAVRFSKLLRRIPTGIDLWNAEDAHLDAVHELLAALDGLPGIGETGATKLLARKRPRLVPVIDSVVRGGLGLGDSPIQELRTALAASGRRRRVDRLRPENAPTDTISTLRLLDAAVWMRLSRSRNAQIARAEVGL